MSNPTGFVIPPLNPAGLAPGPLYVPKPAREIFSIECEAELIRRCLTTAHAYAAAFPANSAQQLPPAVQAWLEHHLANQVAVQIALVKAAGAPPVAAAVS